MAKITAQTLHQQLVLTEQNTETWKGQFSGKLSEMTNVMWAVILVLVVGFVTLLVAVCGLVITYQKDNSAVYASFIEQSKARDDKMDNIERDLKILYEQETIQETD